MFLGFGEGHEGSGAQGYYSDGDGCAYATVDVLSVGDFGDGVGGDVGDLFIPREEFDGVGAEGHAYSGAGFDVGDGASVVGDFVAGVGVGGDQGGREDKAEE